MGLIQTKQVSSCQDIAGLRVKDLGFMVRTKVLRHAACRARLLLPRMAFSHMMRQVPEFQLLDRKAVCLNPSCKGTPLVIL